MNVCSLPPKKMTVCKVCSKHEAVLHGVVDFHKSCEAGKGRYFKLSGIPVWYHRCNACKFLFTEQFDEWTMEEFKENIYNDGYVHVDPESTGLRAFNNRPAVRAFVEHYGIQSVLDYGGGDGTLARLLRESDIDATSWDPLIDPPVERFLTVESKPVRQYDLVTAFEVLEHTPTPIETAKQALSFVRKGGKFLFSTLCLDDLPPQSVDNSYIAPRNGHVSIHSTMSLDVMFGRLGWKVHHFSEGHHLAMEMA